MDFQKLAQIIPKPTSTWTVADTLLWVQFVGLQALSQKFKSLGIDGSCLCNLTEEDFREQLGVSSKIMLKKIMAWIGNGFHNFDQYLKSNKLSMTYKPGTLIKTIHSPQKFSQIKIEEKPRMPENQIKREQTYSDSKKTEENQLIIKQCEVVQANYYSLKGKGGMMGRYAQNQIPISDEFISRLHAEIIFQEGEYFIRDFGSNSGTFIRITEKKKLYNKIILEMGSNQFQVHISQKSVITLKIVEGPNIDDCFVVPKKDKITIGRKPHNEINFPEDHHLSNIHATLFQVNGIWFVEDLGSTNGTWIRLSEEGTKSTKWKLEDKTQFKLSTNLTYECRRNTGNRKTEKDREKADKCIFCKEADRNAIVLPCKHNMTCYQCITSLKIEQCQSCGADIKNVIKIFKV